MEAILWQICGSMNSRVLLKVLNTRHLLCVCVEPCMSRLYSSAATPVTWAEILEQCQHDIGLSVERKCRLVPHPRCALGISAYCKRRWGDCTGECVGAITHLIQLRISCGFAAAVWVITVRKHCPIVAYPEVGYSQRNASVSGRAACTRHHVGVDWGKAAHLRVWSLIWQT